MSMDFHDKKNRYSYTTRSADRSWLQLIANRVRMPGATAADVGCGGGIYTRALFELGAHDVVGIDFSQAMLDGAAAQNADLARVRFQLGTRCKPTLRTRLSGWYWSAR
jgi:2-polyprenyl-3-methyl-5-hydroxy-6-metoxy-1,4-benzoquinol methylase